MTDDALLVYLRTACAGKQQAASRLALASHFHCHDRRIREAGHPIGALPSGGYFMALPHEERDVLAEYDKSLYRRLQIRNRMARNIPGATGRQLALVSAERE